jgi:hypothetical protein
MKRFYQAGGSLENSPISDLHLHAQIPGYSCSVCRSDNITSWYNYPHLDISEVLSKDELKKLGPIIQTKGTDDEIVEIVRRLRRKWNVPVAAGTIFGRTRLKVTTKPKMDFHVLVCHAGLFCRRPAAEKLRREGVPFDYVETPAKGKYAADADYVEFVVPVLGHTKLPSGYSFCNACLRYRPDGSFRTVLLEEQLPADQPFFKTIEGGAIIFSSEFISTVRRTGLTGFVEGKTLLPVSVAKESEPWDDEHDRLLEEKKSKAWQELLKQEGESNE